MLTNYINRLLNKVTSYKTVLYFLIALWTGGLVLSIFGQLTFKVADLALSLAVLSAVAVGSNWLFSKFFSVYTNQNSALITAFILALIYNPAKSKYELVFLALAALGAMASKYLFTEGNKHVFNPAAFGAFVIATIFNKFPSWWVGNRYLFPLLVLGGILLIVKIKKVRRTLLFFGSFIVLLGVGVVIAGSGFSTFPASVIQYLTESPLMFFGLVMLTEPLTSPSDNKNGYIYSLIVAVLFATPQLRIWNISIEPISALLIGNIFSYAVSPIRRIQLSFVKRIKEADSIYSFVFSYADKISFIPGQYVELTIPSSKSDSRGNRRYLTVSSAPSEPVISVTVKMPPNPSSFKKYFMNMKPDDQILASELSGDFTQANLQDSKLCFIAGGIGVTPFKSMASELRESKNNADVKLLYYAASANEFAFRNTFERAEKYGYKTIYSLTQAEAVPKNWSGVVGKISDKNIKKTLPDYKERTYFISGPLGFVQAAEAVLKQLGITKNQIRTDFFPGY